MHYRVYFFSLSCFPPLPLPPPSPPTILHLSIVPFRKRIPQSCKALSVLYKNVPCYRIITQYSYFSMLQSTLHISQEGSKFIFIHFRLEVRSAALHHKSWHAGLGPQKLGHEWSTSPTDTHRWRAHPPPHSALTCHFDWCIFWYNRKSCSWHTLRMRKRAEVENTGKNEATGPRKPKDILGNKVSVKVSKVFWSCVPPLIYSHPAAFSRGNMGGWGLFFPTWGPEGK